MEIRVDQRVELMSILCHLADTPEYRSFDTPYRRAVDAHFARFRDHAAVAAMRELRARYSISYNAPIGLAVFLDASTLLPQVDLAAAGELDPRWRNVPIRDFLDHVRAFASAADLAGFFAGQRSYIASVEQRLARALVDERIESWFAALLAMPAAARFVVVPGLLTGPWNYEATAHDACGRQWVYQVVELEGVDAQGLPSPTHTTTELVAHEMAHSFVNPIVEHHAAELVVAAQPLYVRVRAEMERQRYGTSTIMVEESLVRAITALFTRDRLGLEAASQLVREDQAHGFRWNIELAKWLDRRPRPVDLDALVPELVCWLRDVAPGVA